LHKSDILYQKFQTLEIAYVGNINPEHLRLSKLALDHGKNVLCEKPMAMNLRETQELIAYAKEKKLFLSEGIWSRFFPAYKKLTEEIEKGTIGEPVQVLATFGSNMSNVDRVQ